MLRLSRVAHRIVWVNPRKAAPGFAPVVGGMAAALPYCDAFVSGHSLAALEQRHAELPESLRVRTGSGGLHIYLAAPRAEIRGSAGAPVAAEFVLGSVATTSTGSATCSPMPSW